MLFTILYFQEQCVLLEKKLEETNADLTRRLRQAQEVKLFYESSKAVENTLWYLHNSSLLYELFLNRWVLDLAYVIFYLKNIQ